MADLDEAAVFDAGIRQIETTDPVVGGPPNLSTFAGMANVPHLQLARRTRWLKDKIDNDLDIAGTTSKRGLLLLATSTEAKAGSNTAKALTPAAAADTFLRREVGTDSALDAGDNLDNITTPGIYRWLASSPAGAPSGLTQYAQMIVETDGSQPTQIVWGGLGGRVAVRRRNSGVWGTWNRMWSTEDAPAVLGTTGRQQFPNGLIMQWGTLTLGPSGGNTSEFNLVFPIAFGTACVAPTAIASTTAHPTEGGSPTVIVRSVTRTGMSVSADALDYTTFTQNVPVYWQAIGY